ncbi:MAG: hypothetical protein WCO97_09610 [bacterium]
MRPRIRKSRISFTVVTAMTAERLASSGHDFQNRLAFADNFHRCCLLIRTAKNSMPRTSHPKPKEKAVPSPAIRNRREYLEEMVRRGTEHEAIVAKEKLARLEARFDFLAKQTENIDDIFSGWGTPKKSDTVAPLIAVDTGWRDVASLVKWLLQDKFGIASSWRETKKGCEIVAGIAEADLRRIRPLAKSLLAGITAICGEFFQSAPTTELERAPFLSGLYEGLMNEPRKGGSIVPGRSPIAGKKKRTGVFETDNNSEQQRQRDSDGEFAEVFLNHATSFPRAALITVCASVFPSSTAVSVTDRLRLPAGIAMLVPDLV